MAAVFFADFKAALETYPGDSVTLSITNFSLESGTPTQINVNEIWKFKVNVQNDGDVNMNNVELHVLGQNDTLISTSGVAGPFNSGYQIFGSMTVNAGGSQKSDWLYLQAPPKKKAAGTDLVLVHINNWDADLGNLLETQAGHSASAQVIYEAEVFP